MEARDGIGIVTDVDLRDKVVAVRASVEGPVSSIMSRPVHTVPSDTLAPEASIAMIEAGVNHLPVVDDRGRVAGVLSASSLMSLDSLSPFALRHAILHARSADDVASASAQVPRLFVDLLDAHLDAAALMRILTLLNDTQTTRLLELFADEQGKPPVPYAWLAFGSTARGELTLASDQDNGLAFADTEDPEVLDYFRRMALAVNGGLERCGFVADPHGVVASRDEWRLSFSQWRGVFADCLRGIDLDHLVTAAITFDLRQVAGDLVIVPPLQSIVRQAPRFDRFLNGLSNLATDIRMPLGLGRRVAGQVDLKKKALLPVQNLARYYALFSGFTAVATVERLLAVEEAQVHGCESAPRLRDVFASLCGSAPRAPRIRGPRGTRARRPDRDRASQASDQGEPAGGAARSAGGAAPPPGDPGRQHDTQDLERRPAGAEAPGTAPGTSDQPFQGSTSIRQVLHACPGEVGVMKRLDVRMFTQPARSGESPSAPVGE